MDFTATLIYWFTFKALVNIVVSLTGSTVRELHEILAHDAVDEGRQWKKKLKNQSHAVWLFTSCITGATTYGERSTWECGYVFILFN